MDAKDLRSENTLGECISDGNSNYKHNDGSLQSVDKNKSYLDIGSNPLGKVGVQVRPCAVIGPDRVTPRQATVDPYNKKVHIELEPWQYQYPNKSQFHQKVIDFQQSNQSISPRQTFQDSMHRMTVPPKYNSVDIKGDQNMPVDKSSSPSSKNHKMGEMKYCDVPYHVNPVNSEQKSYRSAEVSLPNINSPYLRGQPQVWPQASVNVHSSHPYPAADMYQYPEYATTVPRVQAARPQRIPSEDQGQMYPPHYYRNSNIRFEPYPAMKERYPPPPRYEYIPNYPYQAAPHYPYKGTQQGMPPHAYPGHVQGHMLREPIIDGYPRNLKPQSNFNIPYPAQSLHPKYSSIPGNCLQSKPYPYSNDCNVNPMVPAKSPYNTGKYYMNPISKPYPTHENYYLNDYQRPHFKGQMIMPNYPSNVQSLPYFRKDIPTAVKSNDPYYNSAKLQQNPPSMLSPTDSLISHGNYHGYTQTMEGSCGYGSPSSMASIRSVDSGIDMYKNYENRYVQMNRMSQSSNDCDSNMQSDKNGLDVRQFLSNFNVDDDEGIESNENTLKSTTECEVVNNKEQLYVLGLVNVPTEELAKYEHIQKVSKLPDNIKGYTSIELLNQFEEAMSSSDADVSSARNTNVISKENLKSTNKNHNAPKKVGIADMQPRPLSPLDVEAKISQSVIHKDVGCNFEIKPCSPKMLNAQAATPVETLLSERLIEKVSNPIKAKSPIPVTKVDEICKSFDSDKTNTLPESQTLIPSCKMVRSQYTISDSDPVKADYSVQDFERSAGVCLASLPRLDNDIELNFPEVNQQFINANKGDGNESNLTDDLPCLDICPDAYVHINNGTDSNINSQEPNTIAAPSGVCNSHPVSHNLPIRTNSVIMKNPENKYLNDILQLHDDRELTTAVARSTDENKETINNSSTKANDKCMDSENCGEDVQNNDINDKHNAIKDTSQLVEGDVTIKPSDCEPTSNTIMKPNLNEDAPTISENYSKNDTYEKSFEKVEEITSYNCLEVDETVPPVSLVSEIPDTRIVQNNNIAEDDALITSDSDTNVLAENALGGIVLSQNNVQDNILENEMQSNSAVASEIFAVCKISENSSCENVSVSFNTDQSSNGKDDSNDDSQLPKLDMELSSTDNSDSKIVPFINDIETDACNNSSHEMLNTNTTSISDASSTLSKTQPDINIEKRTFENEILNFSDDPMTFEDEVASSKDTITLEITNANAAQTCQNQEISNNISDTISSNSPQETSDNSRLCETAEDIQSDSQLLQSDSHLCHKNDENCQPSDVDLSAVTTTCTDNTSVVNYLDPSHSLDNIDNKTEVIDLPESVAEVRSSPDIFKASEMEVDNEVSQSINKTFIETKTVRPFRKKIFSNTFQNLILFQEGSCQPTPNTKAVNDTSNSNDRPSVLDNTQVAETEQGQSPSDVKFTAEHESSDVRETRENQDIFNFLSESPKRLKRSLSDSALSSSARQRCSSEEDLSFSSKPKKRKMCNDVQPNTGPFLTNDYFKLLPINFRRNSVAAMYDENVSICILTEDHCLIPLQNDYSDGTIGFVNMETADDSVDEAVSKDCEVAEFENSNEKEVEVTNEQSDSVVFIDNTVDQNWLEDVACVETVVSDELEDDFEYNASTSSNQELCNTEVKHLYGIEMIGDENLIDTLYTTPQKNVNNAVESDESREQTDEEIESLENSVVENDSFKSRKRLAPELNRTADHCNSPEKENLRLSPSDFTCDDNTHTNPMTDDNVSVESSTNGICHHDSCFPEVSSTTPEENRKSGILLKITNLNGSRTSQIKDSECPKRIRCRFTEENDYSEIKHLCNSKTKQLITKAAQKYIPPLQETVSDFKIKLQLPQHSLAKYKLLKKTKEKPKNAIEVINNNWKVIPNNARRESIKKVKPKFEDVLKSIDDMQIKLHKEKVRKPKPFVPKMIIKKTESGSHYTSNNTVDDFNPDLTGRKWQPWVFLTKDNFIDQMAIRSKRRAIYCHRKKAFILIEKYRKYKSILSTKFVISQTKTKDIPNNPLKCTIKLHREYT